MVEYFLNELGVQWYLDFGAQLDNVPVGHFKLAHIPPSIKIETWDAAAGIESLSDAQLASLGVHTRAQLAQLAQTNPGTLWYIMGEPNRFSHITSSRFATMYHYYYTALKDADPTAKVMGPAILNWSFICFGCPGYQSGQSWIAGTIDLTTGLRAGGFIDAYNSRYGTNPPVDVWAIDVYPLDWNNTPNSGDHVPLAMEQIQKFRDYLDTYPEYVDTPMWLPEIGIHWGYDGWDYDPFPNLVPVGNYHWDKMSDYLNGVLDWLMANSEAQRIEKWFFLAAWENLEDPDDYAGITMFDSLSAEASLTCLGQIYRNRTLGIEPGGKCDPNGNWIPGG